MTSVAELFPGAVPAPPDGGTRVPTPLDPAPELGAELGVRLWIKREDRVDDLGCGHKSRKLAHVVAAARAGGATALVTVASPPSSQAVAVAAHAVRAGLSAHLVYCGDVQRRPPSAAGNYLLAGLLGAEVVWHECTPWVRWPRLLDEAVTRVRLGGAKPFAIPPGVGDWPGLLGSIELGLELAAQLPDDGAATHVVTAAGSGGTAYGIAVAAASLGLPWHVHGVCIGAGPDSVRAEIARQRRDGEHVLGVPLPGPRSISVHDGALGAGYDRWGDVEIAVVRRWLAAQGLLLDPTYTAKAAVGLGLLVAAGEVPAGERTVFVHTGGSQHTLAGAPAFDAELGALVRPSHPEEPQEPSR